MKFLLAVTVLLVTLEFAPSVLAAPVPEEEAEAVLEQIRMLVASAENRVHENQEESIPTATPSTQSPTITVSSSTAAPPSQPSSTTVPSSTASRSSQPPSTTVTVPSATSSQPQSPTVPSATSSQSPSPTVPSSTAAPSTQPPIHPPTPQKLFRCSPFHSSYQWGLRCYFCMDYESGVQDVLCNWR